MELYAGIDLHSRNTFVFLLGCDPDSRKNFGKNPGPYDQALVIPRGDLLCWNFNGLWGDGVME